MSAVNDGDRALFLAMTVQEAWVIGIDVGSGHKLFEPVWLDIPGA